MTRHFAWTLGILAACLLAAGPATARLRHRHRHRYRPMAAAPAPAPATPFSFYPEDIEGGSKGNLPFNNQIRKFTDPLNANGAGG